MAASSGVIVRIFHTTTKQSMFPIRFNLMKVKNDGLNTYFLRPLIYLNDFVVDNLPTQHMALST